jgi:hypothetical protein
MINKLELLRRAERLALARNQAGKSPIERIDISDPVAIKEALEASSKATSQLIVPAPHWLAYFPFQRAGIE